MRFELVDIAVEIHSYGVQFMNLRFLGGYYNGVCFISSINTGKALDQACQTYGPLDGIIRPGLGENTFLTMSKKSKSLAHSCKEL